ncbi:MAG: hypothetical protein Q8K36_07470 [Alphaproteobacteria bacterium]|nr:hypothetical protein [Alphaproteobacteria bacterium]
MMHKALKAWSQFFMLSIVLSVLLSTLSCLFAGPIATKGLIIDCSRGLESVNLAEQQATACLASGPVGAVVAELSADILSPDKPLAQMKEKEQALGRKLTRQEFFELYPAVHQNYFEDVRNVHKASKIIAAIGASFIGGNTAVGVATGANAIDYNAAFAAGWGVSALAETAFGAYLVEGLAAVGGAALGAGGAVLIKEALDFIGVKAVDGGYSYRGQVYASLPDALAAVIIQNPATHAAGSMYLVASSLLKIVGDKPDILTTPIQESKPTIHATPIEEAKPKALVTLPVPDDIRVQKEGFDQAPQLDIDPEGFHVYDGPQETIHEKKIHIVYGKPGPNDAPDYIGRTQGEVPDEGYTETHIDKILEARDRNHHMNARGFGLPYPKAVSENPHAVRGLEQQEIDKQGGAQSQGGTSSNAINGISAKNPKREAYLKAAEQEFGGK